MGSDRKERAVEALDLLGPPVFLGGTSTILGICLTGFCVTYVFQTFFRYLIILILAVWFGLVVMPVVCALIGPKSRRSEAIVAKEDLEAVTDALFPFRAARRRRRTPSSLFRCPRAPPRAMQIQRSKLF